MINFVKSHGLGNDYIVIDGKEVNYSLKKREIIRLCNRNYGIGSDGILMLCKSKNADFGLKIYNPDGSQAEKSGNGLRIFSAFLFDHKYVKNKKIISIETKGGLVKSKFIKKNKNKSIFNVEMGNATFLNNKIPVKIKDKNNSCLNKEINLKNKKFIFNAVSVGNPHCVIFLNKISKDLAKEYGPLIETHRFFPNKINVQFVKIINKSTVNIEIWERGAGYTLASGSSSCGVVSVGYKLGLLNSNVKVQMPGGNLNISIDNNFKLKMEGPVEEICSGKIHID
tara:strand:+ start:6256 stop:7101 length:846 start_codon:yes stop_codon:yes gene_type:complete